MLQKHTIRTDSQCRICSVKGVGRELERERNKNRHLDSFQPNSLHKVLFIVLNRLEQFPEVALSKAAAPPSLCPQAIRRVDLAADTLNYLDEEGGSVCHRSGEYLD
mmetsp:Transcript_21423/g.30009  ORF Transcript_21423/g.30009 Transcript_21423/m.30009 type:complete len:106 (-) Transcript_21423:539-856(-)